MSEAKIIDRIKKLLALSSSTNEHEAANAAAQAAELMQKHEIKQAQLAEGDEDLEDVDTTKLDESGQIIHWKGNVMAGLAKSLGCFMFYSKAYGPNFKRVTRYNVVGQPSKVDTIRYMYQYLIAEIDRLADIAYRQEHIECRKSGVPAPSARGWKNAFRLGASSTIAARLRAQRDKTKQDAQAAGQENALVVVKKNEEAVTQYIATKYPRMGKGAAASFSSTSGYGAGKAAGQNVGLGGGGGKLGAGAKQLGSGN